MGILLSQEEQGVLTFKMLPSLSYPQRIAWSVLLVASGFLFQLFFLRYYLVGCVPMLLGNLLLLVNGYDDRVRFDRYDPKTGWEQISPEDFAELKTKIVDMRRRILLWDYSTLDFSNAVGFLVFLAMLGLIWWLFDAGLSRGDDLRLAAAADIGVLFIPHWVTGLRRIPIKLSGKLEDKMAFLMQVVSLSRDALKHHTVQYYVLKEGEDIAIPKDAKIKVDIAGASPDFLGLYGQISMNNVQGTLYPYFYTVLVAKRGFGLKSDRRLIQAYNRSRRPKTFFSLGDPKLLTESQRRKDVEVLVIRQQAGQKTGYHTSAEIAAKIFQVGIAMAEKAARRG